jgi:hypothetical protein
MASNEMPYHLAGHRFFIGRGLFTGKVHDLKDIPPSRTSLFYREGVSIVGKYMAFSDMPYYLVGYSYFLGGVSILGITMAFNDIIPSDICYDIVIFLEGYITQKTACLL